jgi:outer membrane protein assembly factor BamB
MRRQTPLAAPDGVPCSPPPFGTLTAVDLESGDVKWDVPLGRVERFSAMPGSERWGSPNLGGSLATAGGVVFAGGAMDRRLRAFDQQSGAELWSFELPAGVHGAPMTYVTAAGRQFLVVAAGGHKDLGTKVGDFVFAFALPAKGTVRPAPATISAGHYEGMMVLDKTRAPATIDLKIASGVASVTLTTQKDITGTGSAALAGDSAIVDVAWEHAVKHCSGTMHLAGKAANEGMALIGEITYKDGCDAGKEKLGTFAVWRGQHTVASLPR